VFPFATFEKTNKKNQQESSMSVFAGVVSLHSAAQDRSGDVQAMLAAMSPSDGCPTDTFALPPKGIALGKLRHGADADQVAGLESANSPKLLMLGELYVTPPQGGGSHAAHILDLYRRLGSPAFAKGLNGSFALVIVNPADGFVTLATDHNNAIQVHYMIHERVFYFASEVKGLMALPHLPCRLDEGMALMTLTSDMLQNLRTLVADVNTMDGGSVWELQAGRVRKHKLWSYSLEDNPQDKGLEFFANQAADLIKQAVHRMTRVGRPVVLMTGGLDTRAIISFLGDPKLVHGITLTGVGEEVRHPLGDVALARRVARELGIKQTTVRWYPEQILETLQDSVYNSDGLAGLHLEERAFDEVKRLGQSDYIIAGDECCSAAAGAISQVHVLECLGIRPLAEVPSLWPYLRRDRLKQFLEETEAICRTRVQGLAGRPPNNQLDELEHAQRVCHFVSTRRRMHMRQGLLARLPLLDLDYLNFLGTVPWRQRLGRRPVREALRRFKPQMAAIPYNRTREQVDFGLLIAHMNREGSRALEFLLQDNPLMEEVFDIRALRGLVEKLAASDPAAAAKPRFSIDLLMTRQVRWVLASFARKYLRMRARTLVTPSAILFRVCMVAAALRHVSNRCARPRRTWIP
jgi:asparagine synthetase B (glutamine-hydrolysing)